MGRSNPTLSRTHHRKHDRDSRESRSRLIVITGGSSGIGKQLATSFLHEGDSVVIVSDRQQSLEEAAAELSLLSPRLGAVQCDVGDSHSVQQMAEKVLTDYGCPDILVNNAGFATYRTFEASDIAEVERLVHVNLLGAMRCTKAFLSHMLARRSGSIVNMASIAGKIAMTPNGTYSASKHALVAWSETLRVELLRFGVRVHVICPGRVETPFFAHKTFRRRSRRTETRHRISVDDVCRATIDAIEQGRFITYVPRVYGIGVWLLNAFPVVLRPLYDRLMVSRIDDYYKSGEL